MIEIFANRFLEAVRVHAGVDLAAKCEHVPLPQGTVLFEPDTPPRYVHFITSGFASVVATMKSGSAVEVGMFGYEGFPEAAHLLGPATGSRQCMMQIGGTGYRMNFGSFRQEFRKNEALRDLALGLAQCDALSVAQVAACNALHEVEGRLARWLLMAQDRVGTPDLALTQEFLSYMLGTRRATVTTTARSLQRSGIFDYRRGFIRVEKRDDLEEVACECYGLLKKLRDNLYR